MYTPPNPKIDHQHALLKGSIKGEPFNFQLSISGINKTIFFYLKNSNSNEKYYLSRPLICPELKVAQKLIGAIVKGMSTIFSPVSLSSNLVIEQKPVHCTLDLDESTGNYFLELLIDEREEHSFELCLDENTRLMPIEKDKLWNKLVEKLSPPKIVTDSASTSSSTGTSIPSTSSASNNNPHPGSGLPYTNQTGKKTMKIVRESSVSNDVRYTEILPGNRLLIVTFSEFMILHRDTLQEISKYPCVGPYWENNICLSQNRLWLAICHNDGKKLHVYNVNTGTDVANISLGRSPYCVDFSPDNKSIFVGLDNHKVVQHNFTGSSLSVNREITFSSDPKALAFSIDHNTLFVGLRSGRLAVVHLPSWTIKIEISGLHNTWIRKIRAVTDNIVYTASDDKSIARVNLRNGALLCKFSGFASFVYSCIPFQNILIGGGNRGDIIFFDMETKRSTSTHSMSGSVYRICCADSKLYFGHGSKIACYQMTDA